MKKLKKLFLMSLLTVSSFVLSGVAKVEAADVFSLTSTDVVCDPEYIEAGQQANCYIVGVPSETTTGSVHGYVIKAYTTKKLKLVGATSVVTSTGQTWADATSATKQITPSDDMPDQVKALSCAYDGEGIGSSIKPTSFGCGVFYTVKNSNANAFKPSTITSSATKASIPSTVFKNATYGVIGAVKVKLDQTATTSECGEVCVKVWRVPTATDYENYLTCGNNTGTGCGSETGNAYDCKELHYKKPGELPNTDTGAFASYALLAACALIAVSAITLAKKNNKFSRI
jgi:hypothetical protein